MKKIYSVILPFLLFSTFTLQAQDGKRCYTDEVYREAVKQHPEILERDRELEEFTQNFIRNNPDLRRANPNGTSSVIITIPLVFHIIHQYGQENISDAQVLDAVNILNRDYRKQNADTLDIIPDFKPLAADVELEFRLANIDPSGNCTNGIDRIFSFRTQIGNDQGKLNPWPRNKYLNIWTVASFDSTHAGAAAYAYRPSTTLSASVDGIISLSSYVGSIGTSNGFRSRTLTHEIGHFLNLLHVWGSTNQPGVSCGDDNVNDTPITNGWAFCPSSNFDVCTPGINENFQNYMEYSFCEHMFTYDQKARMIAALNSTTAGRNNLWTAGNLDSTGTNGSPVLTCTPVADFFVSEDHICAGDSVQFFARCFNTDTITGYSWSFPSGSPSVSTLQNPYVTFSTPGQFNVTLTATNATGSHAKTRNSIVTSSGAAALAPNYFNDFETAGTFPGGDGYIINDGGTTWQRNTTVGFNSTACIRMLNYLTAQAKLVDSWVTPAIDLTGYNNAQLTFRMAYAQRVPAWSDRLRVYISNDCGESWFLRKNLSGSQLSTTTNVTGGFTPTSASQWALITVNSMPQINNMPNARVKFEFTSDGDNNLYIDDVNITAAPTGIMEAGIAGLSFDIFPNPSMDEFHVTFELPASGKTEVNVTDLLGREIVTVVKDHLSSGIHEYILNAREFNKGIYLVCLKAGEISTVKKLVIE